MTSAYTDFWQGVGVDRARLAQALPQLPDTADELKGVASDLGVAASDIHLGADASETTVKRARLSDYGIVYFATHGLVAGDVKGLAEPSLALSIPRQPSELDDGLLTSSEVAQLKLNADWVVLSACNTIAGDRPGAEALSGLARSFFYAGARALLVSHWAVDWKPRPGSPLRPSTVSRPNRKSAAPRRCGRRCSPISTMPRRRETPIPPSGSVCADRRGSGALIAVNCAPQQDSGPRRLQIAADCRVSPCRGDLRGWRIASALQQVESHPSPVLE